MRGASRDTRRSRRWVPATVTAVAGFALGIGVAWAVTANNAAPTPGVVAEPLAGTASPPAATSSIPPVSASDVTSAEPEALPSSAFNTEAFSIDDPDSPWVVVNKQRPLEPKEYVPDDLTTVNGVSFSDGGTMREAAAKALATMADAAQEEGLSFRASSAYRAYVRQQSIYAEYVSERGVAKADSFSARPGYSEHQTGWAADLYDSAACRLKVCFGESPVGGWIAEHGADYGFIIRYPQGEEAVTGYKYEPWHVRYVGVDLATQMRDSGALTLEEFFGLPDAPTY